MGKKDDGLISGDTTKIIKAVLSGKEFLIENPDTDTLFFLRNKFFNKDWPTSTKKFKIEYLKDMPQTRMFNIGPGFPNDSRQRLSLIKFEFKNDTARVIILEHGSNLFYDAKLLHINDSWKLIMENAYAGGRLEKFEFENDRWYLDLKKKVKKMINMILLNQKSLKSRKWSNYLFKCSLFKQALKL